MFGCILLVMLHNNARIDWTRNNHPATWPVMLIYGLMLVAGVMLLWGIHDEWRDRRHYKNSNQNVADISSESSLQEHVTLMTEEEADLIASEGVSNVEHDNSKMIWGVVGVFSYGVAITYIGSAFATMAVIVYWLLICGDRSLIKITLTSCLGTAAILYIFQKMAYLPLPKGVGIFHDMTIALYRLIKIF